MTRPDQPSTAGGAPTDSKPRTERRNRELEVAEAAIQIFTPRATRLRPEVLQNARAFVGGHLVPRCSSGRPPADPQPPAIIDTKVRQTFDPSEVRMTPAGREPLITPSMTARFATAGPAPAAPGTDETLTGWIQQGIENGCVILVDGEGQVLAALLGSTGMVGIATRVRVTGRFLPGLITSCQQGVPFRVDELVPL